MVSDEFKGELTKKEKEKIEIFAKDVNERFNYIFENKKFILKNAFIDCLRNDDRYDSLHQILVDKSHVLSLELCSWFMDFIKLKKLYISQFLSIFYRENDLNPSFSMKTPRGQGNRQNLIYIFRIMQIICGDDPLNTGKDINSEIIYHQRKRMIEK